MSVCVRLEFLVVFIPRGGLRGRVSNGGLVVFLLERILRMSAHLLLTEITLEVLWHILHLLSDHPRAL